MGKILITGATGHLGGIVIREIIRRQGAEQVAALVRDPSKAVDLDAMHVDLRKGDYTDVVSLKAAFSGVDKIYFVSSSSMPDIGEQHHNVINAASESGVKHVVYVSGIRAINGPSAIPEIAQAYADTEERLKASGLVYTILVHGIYADQLAEWIPPRKTIDSRFFSLPAGDGKAVYPTREDLALAGAEVITGKGHENKTYYLTGNRSTSFYDVADKLSKLTETNITYTPIPQEVYIRQLKEQGADEAAIHRLLQYMTAYTNGEFDHHDPSLEMLLHRTPVTLTDFLKSLYRLPDDTEDADTIDTYFLR